MSGLVLGLVGLGLTVIANAVALAWSASRISTTVDRLDETLDRVVISLGSESLKNATQDARLDGHEQRITRLEGER